MSAVEAAGDMPVFRIERRFAAKPSLMWRMWTEPEHVMNWFGPKGSTNVLIEHDFRVGGHWQGRTESPGMPPMFGLFVFRAIEPEIYLEWLHGFGDGAGRFVPAPFGPDIPAFITRVWFLPDGDGVTVRLTWTPHEPSAAEIEAFRKMTPGMTGGWTGSFDALDAYLAGL